MKKAFLQLHLAVFFAGFTAILGKLIHLNEGILVAYRMLLSALPLGGILLLRRQLAKSSLPDLLRLFGVGAVIAMHWVTFYGSIKYSNVSVSVTCLSAIGFFTSFFEPAINRRRIDPAEVVLGCLAIGGIYLIFNFYPQYETGIVFGLLSAMFASLFPIFNKRLLQRFTPSNLTFYEMAGGFLALLLLVPLYLRFFPATYFLPTPSDWLWLLVLAGICTVWSFTLSLSALKYISPFTANLTYNLEPVYSIILAFLLFGENRFLGHGFYAGITLILIAIVLQMKRVWNEQRGGSPTVR